MYPVLPFGPFTVPTGPVIILIATTIGLELAGRLGRRLGLATDDVWNTGLIAILAGLIVARLWNVFQFWPVYLAEPLLIVSLRPSGFILLPGLIAALVFGYGYLIYRELEPKSVAASLLVGVVCAWAIIEAGGMLTGQPLGTQTTVPWALHYYGEPRHPVSLYYGVSLAALVICLWPFTPKTKPTQLILYLLLGVGIVYLVFSSFEDNTSTFSTIRLKQIGGFAVALLATFMLSRITQFRNFQKPKDLGDISDK